LTAFFITLMLVHQFYNTGLVMFFGLNNYSCLCATGLA